MNNPNVKSKRNVLLGKLFIEAAERGIPEDQLRDEIAPGLLRGKRLSAANEKEISLVISHITGSRRLQPAQKFPSSLQGLRDEIVHLAKQRWPDTWSSSLNALCRRFGIEHVAFLDLSHAKAIKQKLITWNTSPPREEGCRGTWTGWGNEPLPEEAPF